MNFPGASTESQASLSDGLEEGTEFERENNNQEDSMDDLRDWTRRNSLKSSCCSCSIM